MTGLTWDKRISISALLQIVIVLLALVGSYYRATSKIDSLEQEIVALKEVVKEMKNQDLKDLRDSDAAIRAQHYEMEKQLSFLRGLLLNGNPPDGKKK